MIKAKNFLNVEIKYNKCKNTFIHFKGKSYKGKRAMRVTKKEIHDCAK